MPNIVPFDPTARDLFDEISTWPIFDPHSHINPQSPAARNLDEVLGYHYYTELAHSAGMPSDLVADHLEPRHRARNLSRYLDRIDNTVQYSWLTEIARTFHGFDQTINDQTIDTLFDLADKTKSGPSWDQTVWEKTNLEACFLTNDFDDPLEGWDTSKYVPCLRTDDLVLKLHLPSTVERLKKATNVDTCDYATLKQALGVLFERFKKKGAAACAISLPPDFIPSRSTPLKAVTPIRRAINSMDLRDDEHQEIRRVVFWMLAELCSDHKMPFDLMIGPLRGVYAAGVTGGRDLFDRRVSLHDYNEVFNHFADVTFPVSTLSPDAAGELVAYSWIFPNVVPMGYWWYSNIPTYIAADLKARMQAVPKNKQVGYYSDAYKLEFVLPKFSTFRKILAESLADDCIKGRGWTRCQAIEMAKLVILDNPRRIFGKGD
jgi:glucuronate isomerase